MALSAERNLQKIGAPLFRGGRKRRRAPPVPVSTLWGSCVCCAASEPQRGPIGPLGELRPRPPRE
eukprot:15471315-Alexandrium_andersonii.AAC.1